MKHLVSAMAVVIALCGLAFAYPNYQDSSSHIHDNVTSGTYTGTVTMNDAQAPTIIYITEPNGGQLVFLLSQARSEASERVLLNNINKTLTVTVVVEPTGTKVGVVP